MWYQPTHRRRHPHADHLFFSTCHPLTLSIQLLIVSSSAFLSWSSLSSSSSSSSYHPHCIIILATLMDPPHRSFFSNFSLSKLTKLDSSSSLFFSSSCTFCSTTWKTRMLHFLFSNPGAKTQIMSDLLNLERQGLHIAFVIPLCPIKRKRTMVRIKRRHQLLIQSSSAPCRPSMSPQLPCHSHT